MISKHTINNFLWIDLNCPTNDEVRMVADEYGLEYSITRDLASPTPKPRTYEGDKFLYAIFHIPAFRHSHQTMNQEIDFVIGRNALITARYDSIDALHKFEKQAEVEEILNKGNSKHSHIFFHMMQEIQSSLFDELSYIGDWIYSIDDKMFRGMEREMVITISEASRNLLNFRKSIEPHRDTLKFLEQEGEKRFGPSFKTNITVLIQNLERIQEIAKNNADVLIELRETNNSLLTTKQNEIIKTLTLLASMTIPATVIASIFSMAHIDPPAFVESHYFFWIIVASMVLISLSMFTLFKIKKWL